MDQVVYADDERIFRPTPSVTPRTIEDVRLAYAGARSELRVLGRRCTIFDHLGRAAR